MPTVARVCGCIQNRSLAHSFIHSPSFSPLLSRQRNGSLLHPYRQRQLPRRQHDALWPDDNLPVGDSIKSLDTWARLFRWSKTRVRRFFLNLQKLQLIKYSIDHSLAHIHVVDFLP
ncbi:hypothetical protein [Bacteroides clarus]|uniref:hypothetical protein n=1 Tax=Bacteroides clarus TaxID=626929 RepID=UPI0011C12635|nr:hypothetical protein [Bacteroides clarus]